MDQEPRSDFKPEKLKPIQLDLKMKQPTNIGMFYSLRGSRTYTDNADLLRQLGRMAKGTKNTDRRVFKPLKYK
ncbi:hypothetical protein CYQ91_23405 [Vibrio diabolicus]|uniref:Uncharacterized protein n=1 Tax=Vibrio diabolicus TaxID=50719 RepID=A0AAX1XGK8_9VIBR|nr:hypothetical protein [Vibrio diabolicus]RPB32651.1 hypothetical protein CYQ91_23405 [Vibrio diabolicus]